MEFLKYVALFVGVVFTISWLWVWRMPSANRAKEPPRMQAKSFLFKINPLNWFWLLIDNDDDSIYGPDNYNPGPYVKYSIGLEIGILTLKLVLRKIVSTDPTENIRWKAICWWFRNPMHNLTFYVIGIADKSRTLYGPYGDSTHKPGGGFLFLVSLPDSGIGKLLPRPFVSYVNKYIKFYLGTRPSGGIGAKLNISLTGKNTLR